MVLVFLQMICPNKMILYIYILILCADERRVRGIARRDGRVSVVSGRANGRDARFTRVRTHSKTGFHPVWGWRNARVAHSTAAAWGHGGRGYPPAVGCPRSGCPSRGAISLPCGHARYATVPTRIIARLGNRNCSLSQCVLNFCDVAYKIQLIYFSVSCIIPRVSCLGSCRPTWET